MSAPVGMNADRAREHEHELSLLLAAARVGSKERRLLLRMRREARTMRELYEAGRDG